MEAEGEKRMKGIALVVWNVPDKELFNEQWFKDKVKAKIMNGGHIIKVLHLRIEKDFDDEKEKKDE